MKILELMGFAVFTISLWVLVGRVIDNLTDVSAFPWTSLCGGSMWLIYAAIRIGRG